MEEQPVKEDVIKKAESIIVNPMTERRFGKFLVVQEVMEGNYEAFKKLFEGLIVIRCEYLWASGAFEYTAVSENFDPTPKSKIPPVYDIIVSEKRDEEGKSTYTFKFVKRSWLDEEKKIISPSR